MTLKHRCDFVVFFDYQPNKNERVARYSLERALSARAFTPLVFLSELFPDHDDFI